MGIGCNTCACMYLSLPNHYIFRTKAAVVLCGWPFCRLHNSISECHRTLSSIFCAKFFKNNDGISVIIRHFPEILKSHSSHDVVLLCASCHKKSGVFDQEYKAYFAQLCDAPYKSGGVMIDNDLKKVKSAAR